MKIIRCVKLLRARIRNMLMDAPTGGESLTVPRRIIVFGCMSLVVGIAALGTWAALAPLSGAVMAEGVVRDEGERKTVQHQEGGIVRAILVKDGDHVKAGQLLLTLDNVRPDAELLALQSQLDDEQAKAARLEAERDMKDALTFPPQLMQRALDARTAALLQRERTLFDSERLALTSQLSLLQEQLAQTKQEIATETELVRTSGQSLGISRQELQINEQLRAEGYVTETKMMELRRAAADYQSRQQSDTAELIRSRQKQIDLDLKITSLKNDFVKTADGQLKDTSARIQQITEQLRPAQDVEARTRIVAPVAGEVVGLRVHTVGAAIGPRDPILDLVPAGTPLVVEAKIKPDNVREIVPGGKADVRLTAYNPRTSPVLEGKVAYLSADSLSDRDTHQQFYLARIEIPSDVIVRANRLAREPIVLGPGLRAEVFIKTRSRTAFEYLFEPVWDGIQKSMRD
ncbi:HlyD family type I secretion periplasmic adaptor subunit [Paraburkholderia antibiotica]|uniref:Membrane fusion protein (MFP) family protein n=1 Tax=Paraburkholderia antibiotica TaxID=2728839 RepID=A0A7X9X4V3_9BURK|nr:HlyD family type I secretion periplasmic adaptor subunit [Paraburkholderia antibiotica]NML31466.1 HlyD family type I secretion periplasmic adaptor subunit [Paraburkholderia antibiotica]